MSKYLFLLIFFSLIPVFSEEYYLYPAAYNNLNKKTISVREYKSEKYLTDKDILSWLLETGGGDPDYYLSGVEDVDTFLVWFEAPFKCSVICYEITNSVFLSGATNDLFTMFFATLDSLIDYENDYDEYHGTGDTSGPPPIESVLQVKDTFCYGFDSIWTVVQDTVMNSPIFSTGEIFGAGWIKTTGDSSPNPYIYANGYPPYHTLMHREGEDSLGWYSSWHSIRVRVLVDRIWDGPFLPLMENLPDSYDDGPRAVNMHLYDWGIPGDSSGIDEVLIQYQVNSGTVHEIPCSLYSGDSTDGFWRGNIPGQNAGDTVEYLAIINDYQGNSDTTITFSYIIREGTPGHFLWVENDYTEVSYPGLFQKYSDIMDFWDYYAYGAPDSATIAFYANGTDDTSRTIIWKGWGEISLGDGIDYGAGIYYSDTLWIKILLDNGGNFFLVDQDFGYGCGLTPSYGQASVPAGHWVREYLGAQGLYDDNPLIIGTDFDAFSSDAIFTDLFSGIGYQTAGQINVAPYGWTGDMGFAYTSVYDSVMPSAVVSMYDTNDFTVAYRYYGSPMHNGKVANFGFPFEYVSHPDTLDLIDEEAVDTLIEDVLDWFGIRCGLSDRTIEPDKIIKLFPAGIVTDNVSIKFYLPEEMPVKLSIYDKTGRLIKNLKDAITKAGLNLVRWNGKDRYGSIVPSGIYFCRLKSPDNILTEKMVVLR